MPLPSSAPSFLPVNTTRMAPCSQKFSKPSPLSPQPATLSVDFSSLTECSKCSKPAGRKRHDQPARLGNHHRNHLFGCHSAFHTRAQVAELSNDCAPRCF